jgi:hypothetical protein
MLCVCVTISLDYVDNNNMLLYSVVSESKMCLQLCAKHSRFFAWHCNKAYDADYGGRLGMYVLVETGKSC